MKTMDDVSEILILTNFLENFLALWLTKGDHPQFLGDIKILYTYPNRTHRL